MPFYPYNENARELSRVVKKACWSRQVFKLIQTGGGRDTKLSARDLYRAGRVHV